MSIQATREYVLEQAKLNIELLKSKPSHVGAAKQINASLANIVAMERNIVMHKALERALKKDRDENLPRLPEHGTGPEGERRIPQSMPQMLGAKPAGGMGGEPGGAIDIESEELLEACGETEGGGG